MRAKVLMVQGTMSFVGKSVLVAALCRILGQDGWRAAPFKAQNMALNSAVTAEGHEIGRAQAMQAEAAGIAAHVDMNPILLKPEADSRCQVVVMGRPVGSFAAGDYYRLKPQLWPIVTAALDRLREHYEAVVIEGAGSPAEVNLREGDIVNMRVARYAKAPVLLTGDIDRGGIFAQLVGTLDLLAPEERALVRALVINKFRGDPALLEPGLRFLEERTGLPVAGVLPYIPDLRLSEEDSIALEVASRDRGGMINVAIIRLPHIANFDDFDPLAGEPGVALRYVAAPSELGRPDLIILPGTKTTAADLAHLRASGLAEAIIAAAQAGTAVIGICGGQQMLGRAIHDPQGVEAATPMIEGLGLLPMSTVFAEEKTTHQVRGRVACGFGLLADAEGLPIAGYEIHMGQSGADRSADLRPGEGAALPFHLESRSGSPCDVWDGALSADGRILGTYIHGLFANDGLRRAILANLARWKGIELPSAPLGPSHEFQYERLAALVRQHLNLDRVYEIARLERARWGS